MSKTEGFTVDTPIVWCKRCKARTPHRFEFGKRVYLRKCLAEGCEAVTPFTIEEYTAGMVNDTLSLSPEERKAIKAMIWTLIICVLGLASIVGYGICTR